MTCVHEQHGGTLKSNQTIMVLAIRTVTKIPTTEIKLHDVTVVKLKTPKNKNND